MKGKIKDQVELIKKIRTLEARLKELQGQEARRRKMEETLKQSEAKYRMLVEKMRDGLGILDKNGRIIYVNKMLCRMWGYPRKEIIGRSPVDFLDKDNRRIFKEQMAARKKGIARPYEITWTKRDSSKVTTIMSPEPIIDKDGHFQGSFAIITDITERKKAEEKIEFLARFPSENPYPVLRLGKDNKILYANNAAKALLPTISILEDGRFLIQDWRGIINEAFKSGTMEKGIETRNGGRVFSWVIVPVHEHGYINVYGSDITERKEAEKALRHLSAILENTNDFVSTASPDKKLLYLNKAGRKLVGIGANENISDLKISDMHPRWAGDIIINNGLPTAIRDGVWSGEVALRHHRDEHEIPVLQVLIAHKKADGTLEYLSTIMRDITERKQQEEKLRDAYEKLKRVQSQLIQSAKMASLGLLAAGMAHEINNPAFAILGEAQMLLADQGQDAAARNAAKIILEQAQRIAQVTKRLAEHYGKKEAKSQPVDVNNIIEKAISLLRYQEKMSEVKIIKELDADLPEIQGDENQLLEAVVNIMVNAVQAMQGKGSLTVRTVGSKVTEPNKSKVNKLMLGDRIAVIEIADTGVGMDKEIVDKLCSPFFTTKEKGMGLGLFLSHGIITSHGGAIEAQSKSGEGATFIVKLPISK